MKHFESWVEQDGAPHIESGMSAGGDRPGEPEFRVVTHKGVRYGLRLEHVFWSLLEAAAAAEGVRLSAHIARILADRADGGSGASLLRVHAAQWVSDRLRENSSRTLAPKFVLKVVQTSTSPCFVMDNTNRIAAQNDAFLAVLRDQIDKRDSHSEATVHIRFQSDVGTIRDRLRKANSSYIEDAVEIDVSGRKLRLPARIAGVESSVGASLGLLVLICSSATVPQPIESKSGP